MNSPVLYSDDLEHPEHDEAQTDRELRDVLRRIMETTSRDYGHSVRSVHAKSHALLQGTLTVPAQLDPIYAQGIFSSPGTYPLVMRLSTIPGDVLDDAISVPRGLGLKVLNVPGDRLPGSEGAATQDFLMVNGPAFAAPKASKFLGNLKLLAKTTDKAEWAKKALSTVLQGIERGLEAVGTKSTLISTLGGHPMTNPFGDTYFSQTPFKYGSYVAKFSLAPVSPNLMALTGAKINLAGRRDGLREEMMHLFAHQGATWEFRVQLLRDLDKMPVEDSSVEWSTEISPFVAVATFTVEPQQTWSEARSMVGDDQLAFSPWHGIAAHRPLGSINRVRKASYDMSAQFRGEFNKCPIHEPKSLMLPI
jgi:hypothetical protein